MKKQPLQKRTEMEIYTRKPIMVTLGNKEYEIFPKPIKKTLEWKEKTQATIKHIHSILSVLASMQEKEDVKITQELIDTVFQLLNEDVDIMMDLVFEYEPTLPKEEILDTAYMDEMIICILEVLKLAYPFLARLDSKTIKAFLISSTTKK